MKIYRVKKPLQDNSTLDNVEMFDNVSYNWCVKTYQYTQSSGGIRQFFNMVKKIKPDIIFFYSIKSEMVTLPNSMVERIYYVRADLRTLN
jgi:hypothetical protein